jgi:hypothetical protein
VPRNLVGPRRVRRGVAGLLFLLFWSATADADFDGLWKGRFAGVALDVRDNEAALLQVSESFTWPLDVFGFDADGSFATGDGRRYRLVLREERLDILDDRDATFLSFVPVEELPPVIGPIGDPGIVFDTFWESFAENHALFELVDVDWEAVRDAGRAAAVESETPSALFDVLTTLLEPLNDRHTTLVRPELGQVYRSGPAPDPFWRGRADAFLANVADHYLEGPLQTRGADPRLRFGFLSQDIGYLFVENFLDSGGLPAFVTTLDAVLDELAEARGLVVDLRFNPGGVDRNSLAFLERILAPSRTMAYARERRLTGPLPGAFDTPDVQMLTPVDNPFHRRPLVFLTAADTASAAETVLLAVLASPRVVQVGESSAGVFSNLLVRYFPNGWFSTLSNELFHSLGGVSYEQRGIPPHLPISQDDYDLVNGVDPAVEAAIDAVIAQPDRVDESNSPGTSVSGLWFDPARDGEGWHLQRIDGERVFATFYSYAPGTPGGQDWVVGLGEERDGELQIDEWFTARGGEFGAAPDAPPIEQVPWGRGVIRFRDCNQAVAELSGPDSHRGFVFRLQRLTGVPGLGCGVLGTVSAPSLAGSWFVPERSGEGWLLSPSGERDWVVSWYTFDGAGARRWLIGSGQIEGDGVLRVSTLYSADGARWGHGFRPEDVELRSMGSLEVHPTACGLARFDFSASDNGQQVTFDARQLATLEGLPGCE